MSEKKTIKVKFSRAEIQWIERTADIETSRIFLNFQKLIDTSSKDNSILIQAQVKELEILYNFLRTLRSKLELWDARYDIDTEIVEEEKGK